MEIAIEKLLTEAGVTPTSNRLLVAREIARAGHPVGLIDLESSLDTLDKSSISRVLSLLQKHCIVHTIEDGRGITKYELCHGHSHDESDGIGHSPADMHIHFYCTRCRRTICFEDTAVPIVPIPPGFEVNSVNYMLKGLCPDCSKFSHK